MSGSRFSFPLSFFHCYWLEGFQQMRFNATTIYQLFSCCFNSQRTSGWAPESHSCEIVPLSPSTKVNQFLLFSLKSVSRSCCSPRSPSGTNKLYSAESRRTNLRRADLKVAFSRSKSCIVGLHCLRFCQQHHRWNNCGPAFCGKWVLFTPIG